MNDRRIRLSNRLLASFQLKECLMFKHLLAAALATALVAAPLAPAFAQAATEKTSAKKTAKATKAKKELTPSSKKGRTAGQNGRTTKRKRTSRAAPSTENS